MAATSLSGKDAHSRRCEVTELESLYREHDGKLMVELVLRSVVQLFNSLDPAPFHEKDLDSDAEDYIYNAVDDIPHAREVELIIYLPPLLVTPENRDAIVKGIRNHFLYKAVNTVKEQRRLFRLGRIVLLIGLVVLFFCLLARQILPGFPDSVVNRMLQEAFLIIGWVAMWEPVRIFLYDWWPIYHRRRMYRKIAEMDVFIHPIPEGGIRPVSLMPAPVTPQSLGGL